MCVSDIQQLADNDAHSPLARLQQVALYQSELLGHVTFSGQLSFSGFLLLCLFKAVSVAWSRMMRLIMSLK